MIFSHNKTKDLIYQNVFQTLFFFEKYKPVIEDGNWLLNITLTGWQPQISWRRKSGFIFSNIIN